MVRLLHLLGLCTSLVLASPQTPDLQSQGPNSVAPIAPFDAPTAYPLSLQKQDAAAANQIRNTLAHYPLAIDGKNFAALDRVFTTDAVANYSAPLNVLTPLSTIQQVLEQSLAPVLSQHTLGTQVIEVAKNGKTARSLTYFVANQFGTGAKEGKVVYSYAQYQDNWVKVKDGWRIKHRNLVYMGPNVGDLSIFVP